MRYEGDVVLAVDANWSRLYLSVTNVSTSPAHEGKGLEDVLTTIEARFEIEDPANVGLRDVSGPWPDHRGSAPRQHHSCLKVSPLAR